MKNSEINKKKIVIAKIIWKWEEKKQYLNKSNDRAM